MAKFQLELTSLQVWPKTPKPFDLFSESSFTNFSKLNDHLDYKSTKIFLMMTLVNKLSLVLVIRIGRCSILRLRLYLYFLHTWSRIKWVSSKKRVRRMSTLPSPIKKIFIFSLVIPTGLWKGQFSKNNILLCHADVIHPKCSIAFLLVAACFRQAIICHRFIQVTTAMRDFITK